LAGSWLKASRHLLYCRQQTVEHTLVTRTGLPKNLFCNGAEMAHLLLLATELSKDPANKGRGQPRNCARQQRALLNKFKHCGNGEAAPLRLLNQDTHVHRVTMLDLPLRDSEVPAGRDDLAEAIQGFGKLSHIELMALCISAVEPDGNAVQNANWIRAAHSGPPPSPSPAILALDSFRERVTEPGSAG
jgi:hypothetical protein